MWEHDKTIQILRMCNLKFQTTGDRFLDIESPELSVLLDLGFSGSSAYGEDYPDIVYTISDEFEAYDYYTEIEKSVYGSYYVSVYEYEHGSAPKARIEIIDVRNLESMVAIHGIMKLIFPNLANIKADVRRDIFQTIIYEKWPWSIKEAYEKYQSETANNISNTDAIFEALVSGNNLF